MKRSHSAPIVLTVLSLAACARQVPLAYVPTTQVTVQAQPAIEKVTATDQRGESDPTWIGAVRGGYGNPLKVLHTPRPLANVMVDAFRDALTARGLLAQNGAAPATLAITIVEFSSSQYVRREANVDLVLELQDRATGRQLYRDEVKSNPVRGSGFALDVGAFGSSDDLQAVAQTAMNQAIDEALNKPAFSAALHAAPSPQAANLAEQPDAFRRL